MEGERILAIAIAVLIGWGIGKILGEFVFIGIEKWKERK